MEMPWCYGLTRGVLQRLKGENEKGPTGRPTAAVCHAAFR